MKGTRSLFTVDLAAFLLVVLWVPSASEALRPTNRGPSLSSLRLGRRGLIRFGAAAPFSLVGKDAIASEARNNGLAALLKKKDPSLLKNRVFNIPPSSVVYPSWLRGSWEIASNLNGYIFPSQNIPKEKIVQNPIVPGFQKCSVAATADIGKENVKYEWRVDRETGLEDRNFNFRSEIDAYLGYQAVDSVVYDSKSNPNRVSIDFVDYKTVNAERIELFCNARDSEEYTEDGQQIFVCSEYARQVTFGTGSTVGVPRQVGTNYAHFWTWKQVSDDKLVGNLLTAGFLDPQDSMYFQETVLPVVIYSHVMKGSRLS